jgi:uncharacterized membrane protein
VNETGRVEAFSDGVFAVAITLLALELKVPQLVGQVQGRLWGELARQWPGFVAYVVSFLVIGIMWATHHQAFGCIVRVDRVLVFLNLLLLLGVVLLPWAAQLVAEYLDTPRGGTVAAVVYSGVMTYHAFSFGLLWWWVVRQGSGLLDPALDDDAARAMLPLFLVGSLVYPALVGVSFLSALAAVVLHGVMAVYYAFNQLAVPRREAEAGVGRGTG